MANDRLGEGAGRAGLSVEDARRFYQERHGANAAAPSEAPLRAETSHYGAGPVATPASATIGTVETSRDMSRGQRHPDPQYHEWREARIVETDKDYDAFRAQHRGDPAQAFGAWRAARGGGSATQATNRTSDGTRDANRDLALGESPNQGSGGPRILDRSFGGTYND